MSYYVVRYLNARIEIRAVNITAARAWAKTTLGLPASAVSREKENQ